MSGGHFQYQQYKLGYIADDIEQFVITNDSTETNQYGDRVGAGYSKETIKEFKQAIFYLNMAQIYAQRIDWLVSGDDGEKTFHNRLQDDINKFVGSCK